MDRKDHGFTLLELIIVIFLITLMLGLSLPFFANSLPSGRLDATARGIAATIRHARTFSQANNEVTAMVIDLDSRHYGIEGQGSKAIPADINIKVIDSFSGEVHSGKYQITFQPLGGMDGGEIILWNAKKAVSINLDPIIGAVVVR